MSRHHLSDACGSEAKHCKAANEQLVALGEAQGQGHGGVLAQAQLELLCSNTITLVADDLALACARDVGLGVGLQSFTHVKRCTIRSEQVLVSVRWGRDVCGHERRACLRLVQGGHASAVREACSSHTETESRLQAIAVHIHVVEVAW